MCSLVHVYAGIIYSTLRTFSLPLYTMSTSIILTPGLTLNSSNHTLWARTTIVLSYKPGNPSGPAGLCGISIGGRACSNSLPQALLHQRRDLPHRMILHLYKAISTSIVVWNAMGKIKKN